MNILPKPERGCWVNIVSPTEPEQRWMREALGIMPEFVQSALDDEEMSHTDFDDDTGQVLVILDCPFVEDKAEAEDPSIVQYDTHPLSVLFVPEGDLIVTVSLRPSETLQVFMDGKVRDVSTQQRTRLLLRMFLQAAQRYQVYLRNINRQFNKSERTLHENTSNTELKKMLGLQKSLVYFSTSLKADEATLAKINGGRLVNLYEEDRDLLEDVAIEIRQAVEMCTIYTGILTGTMDTFGSIISNNLNVTIRLLTVITLVLAIPTIVFSFYGMNVDNLPAVGNWIVPACAAVVGCVLVVIVLKVSKLLK